MILRPDILASAIDFVNSRIPNEKTHKILNLSPKGKRFSQKIAKDLLNSDVISIICGRYEGVDERLLLTRNIEEISLGDFITSGGDQAALILIDTVVRLLPGVLGKKESLKEESFEDNLLEYPHYTRPKIWEGKEVPSILLSGKHAEIKEWRLKQSKKITKKRRPDLWKEYIEKKGIKNEYY